MTIKEEKALKNYIKGLIRENLGEIRDIDDDNYFGGGLGDHYFDDEPDFDDEENDAPDQSDLRPFGGEMDNPRSKYDGPDVTSKSYDRFGSPAGLDEISLPGYDRWKTSTPSSWEAPDQISRDDFQNTYIKHNNLDDREKREFLEWLGDYTGEDVSGLVNDPNPLAKAIGIGIVDWKEVCSDFLDIHPVDWYKSDREEDRSGLSELRKLCENFAREAMFGNEQDYEDDPIGPEDDDMMNDNPGLNQPSAKFMSKEYMAWAQKVADQAMKKYGRERAVDIWRDLTDQSNEEENMRRFKAETSASLNELNGHEDLFGDVEDPEDFDFNNVDDDDFDDEDYEQDYGIYELRKLCEGMARNAVSNMLMEKKGGKGWKNKSKDKKRKNKKEKTSSKDKTIVSKLNADGTNAAHYFYKLYGVENGTEAEKASARSKGYKKAKGKKNDTGVPYKFTSKERNRLNSLLTDK